MTTTTTTTLTTTMGMGMTNTMVRCQAVMTMRKDLGAARITEMTPSTATRQGMALLALEVTIAAVTTRHLLRDLLALTTAAALARAAAATHQP